MKKYILFFIILSLFTGKSFAQFSFDRFMDERLVIPDRDTEVNMEKLMQTAQNAKLDNVAIKVINARVKSGKITMQTITNANLAVKEAKKLNDLLIKKLKTKLGKVTKQNVINGVTNNMWQMKDGVTVMLTYSGNMCMLVRMKK